MKRTLAAFVVFAVASAAAAATDPLAQAAGIGQKLPRITAPSVIMTGNEERTAAFDSQQLGKVTAYVIVGTRCPTTAVYVERFKELEKAYAPKGIEFVYIYPNRDDSPEAKRAFHKEHGFAGRMIDDQGAAIAKTLQAKRTSEFVLVDKNGTILFRGGIDDSKEADKVTKRHAAAALDEHLAGKTISVSASQVFA
jgi:hypothetical protein